MSEINEVILPMTDQIKRSLYICIYLNQISQARNQVLLSQNQVFTVRSGSVNISNTTYQSRQPILCIISHPMEEGNISNTTYQSSQSILCILSHPMEEGNISNATYQSRQSILCIISHPMEEGNISNTTYQSRHPILCTLSHPNYFQYHKPIGRTNPMYFYLQQRIHLRTDSRHPCLEMMDKNVGENAVTIRAHLKQDTVD